MMEKSFEIIIHIINNSTLEESEKNKLLNFVEMTKKEIEDVEKSKNLYKKQKNCYKYAYHTSIINACVCCGIFDIKEQILSFG